MSLIRNTILNAMLTDDSFTVKQDQDMIRFYKGMTLLEREAVNNIFISLCGYSLETIIKMNDSDLEENTKKNINIDFQKQI